MRVLRPFESARMRIQMAQNNQPLFQYEEKVPLIHRESILALFLLFIALLCFGLGIYFFIQRKKPYKFFGTLMFFVIAATVLMLFDSQKILAYEIGNRYFVNEDVANAYKWIPYNYVSWDYYGLPFLVDAVRTSETSNNPYSEYITNADGSPLKQYLTITDHGKAVPIPTNNLGPDKEWFFDLIQPKMYIGPAIDCTTGDGYWNNEVPQWSEFCIDITYTDTAEAMGTMNTVVALSGEEVPATNPLWDYHAGFEIYGNPRMRDVVKIDAWWGMESPTYSDNEWKKSPNIIQEFKAPESGVCPDGYTILDDVLLGKYCSYQDNGGDILTGESWSYFAFYSLTFNDKRFWPYKAPMRLGLDHDAVTIQTEHSESLKEAQSSEDDIPSYQITANNVLKYGITVICPAWSTQVGTKCMAVCGTNAKDFQGATLTTFPVEGTVCSSGKASSDTPEFPSLGSSTTWQCLGPDNAVTTDDATCVASLCKAGEAWDGTQCIAPPIPPICGTANQKSYSALTLNYGTDSLCAAGTPNRTTFPTIGSKMNWTCSKTFWNGTPYSVGCSATRCNYGETIVNNKCVPEPRCWEINGGWVPTQCATKPKCGFNVTAMAWYPMSWVDPLSTSHDKAYCTSGKKVKGIHTFKSGVPVSENFQWYCVNESNPDCISWSLGTCYNAWDAVACLVLPDDDRFPKVTRTFVTTLPRECKWSLGMSNKFEGIESNTVTWSAPQVSEQQDGQKLSGIKYIWVDETWKIINGDDGLANTLEVTYTSGWTKSMSVIIVAIVQDNGNPTYIKKIDEISCWPVNIAWLPETPAEPASVICTDPSLWCAEWSVMSRSQDASGKYTWICRGLTSAGTPNEVSCSAQWMSAADLAAALGASAPVSCNASFDCASDMVWDTTIQSCVPPLTVTCSGMPSPVATHKNVTWIASPSGGNGIFSYNWAGSVAGDGISRRTSYTTAGTKTASVTVISGNQTATSQSCVVDVEVDQCLNIVGIQTSLAAGIDQDASGNCSCANGASNPPICNDFACGTNARSYAVGEINYAGNFCQSPNTLSGNIPSFPERGTTVYWECVSGTSSTLCSASREDCIAPEKWNGLECATPLSGTCWPAAREYAPPENTYTQALCTAWTPTPSSPSFPSINVGVTWKCQ